MKLKRLHLSLLMFFQLCVVGTYVSILSMDLKESLGFSGIHTSIILSLITIPAVIIPFLSAFAESGWVTGLKGNLFTGYISENFIKIPTDGSDK